jgi:hypothetical protein
LDSAVAAQLLDRDNIGDLLQLSVAPEGTDRIIIDDQSVSLLKYIEVSDLMAYVADELLTRDNIGNLPWLNTAPSSTDRLVIDDVSTGTLKYTEVRRLMEYLPDAWEEGDSSSASAEVSSTVWTPEYTFSETVPVAGLYLIMVTVTGTVSANAGGVGYIELELEDFNDATGFQVPVRVGGVDARGGTSAQSGTSSATLMRVCSVLSSGFKTATVRARRVNVTGSVTSYFLNGYTYQVALLK